MSVMAEVRAYRRSRVRYLLEHMTPEQMLRIVVRARVARLRWCLRRYYAHEEFCEFAAHFCSREVKP
jgi:hypothetical protein